MFVFFLSFLMTETWSYVIFVPTAAQGWVIVDLSISAKQITRDRALLAQCQQSTHTILQK